MNNQLSDLDKKKILIVLGVVVIAILAVLIFLNQRANQAKLKVDDVIIPVVPEKKIVEEVIPPDKLRVAVPKDIKVPEPNAPLSATEKTEIAVPTISVPAAPGVAANYRSFEVRAENNKFTPAKIIVNLGDTVHINLTAVDKDYDLTFKSYNLKQTALKGQTKPLEFQAGQAGNYLYYCELCGGVDGPTTGNIIITKKQ